MDDKLTQARKKMEQAKRQKKGGKNREEQRRDNIDSCRDNIIGHMVSQKFPIVQNFIPYGDTEKNKLEFAPLENVFNAVGQLISSYQELEDKALESQEKGMY